MKVTFGSDSNYPEGTVWKLVEQCAGEELYEAEIDNSDNEFPYAFTACIPRSTYTFGLYDGNGDEIDSSALSVTVNYDGKGDLDIGSSGSFNFGESDFTCAPTSAPTALVCGDDEVVFELALALEDVGDSRSLLWTLDYECSGERLLREIVLHLDFKSSYYHSSCVPKGTYTCELIRLDSFSNDSIDAIATYDGRDYILTTSDNFFDYSYSAVLGEEQGDVTCAPTPAPMPLQCGDGEATFEVFIDFKIFQTMRSRIYWTLSDECTGDQVYTKSYDILEYILETERFSMCISRRGSYVFDLVDLNGEYLDLDPTAELATIKVNYDGGEYELEVGGNYGPSTQTTFGGNCSPTSGVSAQATPSFPSLLFFSLLLLF